MPKRSKKKQKGTNWNNIFQRVASKVNETHGLHNHVTGFVTNEQVADIFINGGNDSHPMVQSIKMQLKKHLQ